MIKKDYLSAMEIDAIGEILNISLGASATAVSTMLDRRVDITTPKVRVEQKKNFSFSHLTPAIGVEITYIKGLSGNNIMLLKRSDVKIIVELLMRTEISDESFELDEMNISAVCEVMNQMMGSSATAMSELFGKSVNISTPRSFEIASEEQFKDQYFEGERPMVVISFRIKIEDKIDSEFLNIMSIELAKELVSGFFPGGIPDNGKEEEKEEADMPPAPEEAKEPEREPEAVKQSPCPVSEKKEEAASFRENGISAEIKMLEQLTKTMQMMQEQMTEMQRGRESKQISVAKVPVPNLNIGNAPADGDVNLDLIMGVPLELSVEIGRTQKLVKDILELDKGSLVVLDRIAGETADLYVNGQCIAKGDVVVVDDNFGIRITEILQEEETSEK